MTRNSLTRRQALRIASGVSLVGLAGCTGLANESTGGTTDDRGDATATGTHDDSHAGETEAASHDQGDGHDDENGHDDGSSHGDEIGDPVDHAEVAMITTDDGYHFEPHVVRVTKGGTVTFVNESGDHTSTAYHSENERPLLMPEDAAPWDSELLTEDDATFEHTFETEGVYHHFCEPHEAAGMIGSVIVGEPDPHEQRALEDPPEDMPEEVRHKIESLNDTCNAALGHTH